VTGSGFYTAREASRISGVPLTTLAFWARTGVIEPSQQRRRPRLYSFEDLRDLRVAQALRDQGARRGQIRAVVDFVRAETRDDPERLAQAEVDVVGDVIAYRDRQRGIEPLEPSGHGQRVLAVDMRDIFRDLVRPAGGVATLTPARRVAIDPGVRGGTPVIDGTRIPTALIAELLADGSTVDAIVAAYPAIDAEDVLAAAEWEKQPRRVAR
jgi:uncharacterized protein (DUF433 family)/DNA-binding transcriptional MerR regulator